MNIYKKEIKRNLKSTLIWTGSMSLLNFLQMTAYPSIVTQTKALEQLLSKMPKELVAAFGMDKLNMTEILNYYGTKSYALLLLLGGIFSIILFSSIFIKEKDEKTIEFLLSKPITRNQMITEKIAAGLTLIFLFNVFVSIITYISFETYKGSEDYDMHVFILLCIGSFLLDLIFGVFGAFLSAFFSRGKTVTSLAIGITLISYFIGILSGSSDKFNRLKYFSPFKFVDSVDIILNKRLDNTLMIITTLTVITVITLTYVIYNKRDIV